MQRKYGFDGWWVATQVDHAVLTFGSQVEGLLSELDSKGKPKYTLQGLLNKPETRNHAPQEVTRFTRSSGMIQPKPVDKTKIVASSN